MTGVTGSWLYEPLTWDSSLEPLSTPVHPVASKPRQQRNHHDQTEAAGIRIPMAVAVRLTAAATIRRRPPDYVHEETCPARARAIEAASDTGVHGMVSSYNPADQRYPGYGRRHRTPRSRTSNTSHRPSRGRATYMYTATFGAGHRPLASGGDDQMLILDTDPDRPRRALTSSGRQCGTTEPHDHPARRLDHRHRAGHCWASSIAPCWATSPADAPTEHRADELRQLAKSCIGPTRCRRCDTKSTRRRRSACSKSQGDDLISVGEAAALLGLSRRSVQRMAAGPGGLSAVRIGHTWALHRSSFWH